MRILDKYILRHFLIHFVILLAMLMLLFILVDTLVDVDEFIKAANTRSEASGRSAVLTFMFVLVDWYVPQMILIYVFFSGVLVVAGMGFAMINLSKSRELVAMVTSGISMHRIAAPVLVAGCVLNALVLPIHEFIIPGLAAKLGRQKSQIALETMRSFAITYAPDGKGNLFTASRYDAAKQVMDNVTILQRDDMGRAQRRISATQAKWDNDRQGWVLINGFAVQRQEASDPFNSQSTNTVQQVELFETDLSPSLLLVRRAKAFPMLLSMSELRSLLDSSAVRSDTALTMKLSETMQSRFSFFVVNVLIQVMAMPFFLMRAPGNPMMASMKGAGVGLGAWGLALLMVQVGVVPMNPLLTAWLPVVIFLPIAAVMLISVRT